MSYFLAFKSEAMMPIKVGLSNHQTIHFSHVQNNDNLRAELDLLEGGKWPTYRQQLTSNV